ncbi:MAG: oligosaccharide flippase family protein [Leptolyngbya sp. BL-A-14]
MSSTKKLAIHGAIWTISGYGISQLLRFGSNLALTHLLFPELFGLMALVGVFIGGLHLFSDIGIGPSIIQNRRGDEPIFQNTAWTLQVLRGILLWLCCVVIAFPVSHFYREPQLLWLLPLVGLNSVISGFNSTGLYTLNRNLSVKELSLFELMGQLITVGVTLIWAWFDKSIWALVAGGLTSSIYQLVRSHQLNPGAPNRFVWEAKAVQQIVSFGKWIFLSTAMTFLSTQSDRLVLGRLLSIEMLGIYGIAYTLADIPKQLTMAIGGKVIFPMYAKLADLPREEFRERIQRSRLPILLGATLGISLFVSFGDVVITLLYDDRYKEAAWMLPILALGIWPVILNTTLDQGLFAIGNIRYVVLGTFFSAVFLIGGMWLGFQFFGPVGAVIAVPFSNVPPYFIITYGLYREKLACIGQDLKTTGLFLALLALFIGGRLIAGFPLPIPGV